MHTKWSPATHLQWLRRMMLLSALAFILRDGMNLERRPGFLDGLSFTVAVTAASRIMILRDRLLRRVSTRRLSDAPGQSVSRHSISSGRELLDAAFVMPAGESPRAALLICHGIGETIDHWLAVQHLLAEQGIASLVFDYAGYGRSTGTVRWEQCEVDAVAAFELLRSLAPALQPSVLGFSMGSGIAAAIMDRISPKHLVLCAAFTSFQAATCAVGLPKRLAFVAPPIWNTSECLRRCPSPPLIIHGGGDRLFPQQMALDLAARCQPSAEFVIVANQRHNEPFRRPHLSYWGNIIRRLTPDHQAAPSLWQVEHIPEP